MFTPSGTRKETLMRSLALTLAMTCLLATTAFGQAKFVEANAPDGKSLVYVYLPSVSLIQGVGKPNVLLLDKNGAIAVLSNSSYCAFTSDPGTMKLWIAGITAAEVKIDVVANQTYYIRAELNFVPFVGVAATLKLMPHDTALQEIANCKPVGD